MSGPNEYVAGVHDGSHESTLHAVVTGDLEPGDPRAAALAESCEVCRKYLAEMRQVHGLLDQVLGEERESIATLPDAAAAPGAERVAHTLEALMAQRPAAPPEPEAAPVTPRRLGRRPTFWRVSAAAAAVMAAGWLVRLLLPPAPSHASEDVTLGSQRLREMFPEGVVDAIESFRWDLGLAEGVRYVVRVWGRGESLTEEPRITATIDDETQWTPTPEQLELLPNAIYWEVEAWDANGISVLAFERAEAVQGSR